MIYSVKGELIHTEVGLAVVECGGVGYACRTSRQTLNSIKTGSEVKLFTYLHVSENSLDLFGFSDTMELSCFRQLISVGAFGDIAVKACALHNHRRRENSHEVPGYRVKNRAEDSS